MKNLQKFTLLLLTIATCLSCSKGYDDSELRGRIENLETWQSTVNSQITALQGLVTALEGNDYITSVTELTDKSGYTINFSKSAPVTIRHGQKGADATAPVVGVKKDTDGKYYWTLDGEYILSGVDKIPTTGENGSDGVTPNIGENGNWWIGATDTGVKAQGSNGNDGVAPHIGENGNWWIGMTDTGLKAQGNNGNDGVAPTVRINSESIEWEISSDGGITYTTTGVKATGDKGDTGLQGDAIFAANGVDISNPDNVTFTLADGTKITLPRITASIIGFDSYDFLSIVPDFARNTGVVLSSNLTENEFAAIIATIEHKDGSITEIKTKALTADWEVNITNPTFENGKLKSQPIVKIKANASVADNTQALLTVSVLTSKGEKISTSRILYKSSDPILPIASDGKVFDTGNLLWLSKQLQDGTLDTKDKVYTMTQDIDMDGITIDPIGATVAKAFKGTFDGQGHTIKNYKVNNVSTADSGIGLFGVSAGTIMNLNAEGDVSLSGNDDAYGTGGIVGVNYTAGKVLNCSFVGNVSSTQCMFTCTGGVVGLNQDGLVAGCSYKAAAGKKVTADNGQGCGGVVGSNSSSTSNAYTIGCCNYGEVSPSDNCWNLGGVAGMNSGTSPNKALMVACYNVGQVSGVKSTSTGGVTGTTVKGSVTACYNTEDITATGEKTPYLIASGDNSGILSNCFWLETSSQTPYAPGILPANITNCNALSKASLNSTSTVDDLNAAIDAWNTENDNLCAYKFVVGEEHPILISK